MEKTPIKISIVEDDFTDALERYRPIITDDREVRLFFEACHAGDFHKDPYERLSYEGRQALFRVGFKDVIPFAGGDKSMYKVRSSADIYIIDEMMGDGFCYAEICGKDKSFVLVGKDKEYNNFGRFGISLPSYPNPWPKEWGLTFTWTPSTFNLKEIDADIKKLAQEDGFRIVDVSIQGFLERVLDEIEKGK